MLAPLEDADVVRCSRTAPPWSHRGENSVMTLRVKVFAKNHGTRRTLVKLLYVRVVFPNEQIKSYESRQRKRGFFANRDVENI